MVSRPRAARGAGIDWLLLRSGKDDRLEVTVDRLEWNERYAKSGRQLIKNCFTKAIQQ